MQCRQSLSRGCIWVASQPLIVGIESLWSQSLGDWGLLHDLQSGRGGFQHILGRGQSLEFLTNHKHWACRLLKELSGVPGFHDSVLLVILLGIHAATGTDLSITSQTIPLQVTPPPPRASPSPLSETWKAIIWNAWLEFSPSFQGGSCLYFKMYNGMRNAHKLKVEPMLVRTCLISEGFQALVIAPLIRYTPSFSISGLEYCSAFPIPPHLTWYYAI